MKAIVTPNDGKNKTLIIFTGDENEIIDCAEVEEVLLDTEGNILKEINQKIQTNKRIQ